MGIGGHAVWAFFGEYVFEEKQFCSTILKILVITGPLYFVFQY